MALHSLNKENKVTADNVNLKEENIKYVNVAIK